MHPLDNFPEVPKIQGAWSKCVVLMFILGLLYYTTTDLNSNILLIVYIDTWTPFALSGFIRPLCLSDSNEEMSALLHNEICKYIFFFFKSCKLNITFMKSTCAVWVHVARPFCADMDTLLRSEREKQLESLYLRGTSRQRSLGLRLSLWQRLKGIRRKERKKHLQRFE